jgi:transposase
LEDALPVDHPVRHVDAILRSEAFQETFRDWENEYLLLEGKPPYHPRFLAGLYLYGMLNRIRSSRQLEASCHNRIDVKWLMSGQCPDHSTIAAFVNKHGKRLRSLFRDVVKVADRAGLVKLDQVAIDGTKIEADAGKGSVHKEESIQKHLGKLDEQIAKLEAEWQANEKQEESLLGDVVPWTPKAHDSMERRLSRMKKEQERLNQALKEIGRRREENVEAGAKPPKAIASVTDPESRVMPDKEGKSKPNYNAQLAVDTAHGVVVAAQVNDEAVDTGQLTPMLKEVEQQCGRLPQEASADSAYNSGPELAALEEMKVAGFLPDSGEGSGPKKGKSPEEEKKTEEALAAVQRGEALSVEQASALPQDDQGRIDKSAFTYDAEKDAYRCPMGQMLTFVRSSQDRKKSGVMIRRQYGDCAACAACPLARLCCKDPSKGRMINRDQYEAHRERLRARMNSEEGRQKYKKRRETVEPRIGWAKRGLGVRRFMRRGLEAVTTEWSLVATAMNVAILLKNWEQVMRVIG